MKLPVTFCNYKIDFVNENGSTPHTHSATSEIIQTFDDFGNILINGELFKMQKNGLYFIHGPSTHFVMPDDINRYNHSIIGLDNFVLERLCLELSMKSAYNKIFLENGGTFCSLSNEDVLKVDRIFLNIQKEMETDSELKCAKLMGYITELFETGLSSASENDLSNNKINDIISFVYDNALTKISIDDICKHSHISKYHLCRIFKENVGITIGNFIKNRRLSVAKQLLVGTDMTVTEIAYKCCFSDNSFFTKTFSAEFGMSPSTYREKYR